MTTTTKKQAVTKAERKLAAAKRKVEEARELLLDAGDELVAAGFSRDHLGRILELVVTAAIKLEGA